MVPRLSFPMCDVRDVARAHISAMKSPKAAGEAHSIFLNLCEDEIIGISTAHFCRRGFDLLEAIKMFQMDCTHHLGPKRCLNDIMLYCTLSSSLFLIVLLFTYFALCYFILSIVL